MSRDVERAYRADIVLAAALLAVDPRGLGGAALRSPHGPARDRWLELLRELLPPGEPMRRIPPRVDDDRLLGGLDLAATLRSGHAVAQRGLLAEADGGLAVLAMAERIEAATAARLAAALDTGEVVLERDGLARTFPARFGIVALDEGRADDERPPAALLDRLAFLLALDGVPASALQAPFATRATVAAARALHPQVRVDDGCLAAICEAALELGIASIRPCILAVRAARAAAALAGRSVAAPEDAVLAARLVLAPRAVVAPAAQPPAPQPPEPQPPPPDGEPEAGPSREAGSAGEAEVGEDDLANLVLAAARAAIPAGLLARLQAPAGAARASSSGRSNALQQGGRRGRPVGVRRGHPRGGARLNVLATLRAAVPWQRLRLLECPGLHAAPAGVRRIEVRGDDFFVTRRKQSARTTTVFVVDASGSAALNRLAEAKGAVELLLGDCYVRRDQVALIAFRGRGAETLLAPTRSLVRAKRSLAGLPGGGGTPLASGIDAAIALCHRVRRAGDRPVVILLTDGRANVARDGSAGRDRAQEQALTAARAFHAERFTALVIDTSPRPQPEAAGIAAAMAAAYLPLPYADARSIARAIEAGQPPRRPG